MMQALPPAWRRSLPGFLLALLAVLLLFGRTGLAMVEIWDRSETFAHAFVVPPIALWLVWRQRKLLALCTPTPAPIFLLPMALMALAWLAGELVSVNAVTQLAFTAMLVLCVPLLLGRSVASVLMFPLGFLFFAVPVGEFMLPQLMQWTADFTVLALQISGVPVYREGLHFIIPSGSWSVVQACSGIRYLIASVMVGTLFAYLNYRSLKRRLIFVAVSFALPLLANWVRAYMIVMLGHLSDNKIATGVDHLIYGWIFFGVVMLLLFMIGMRWSEPDAATPQPEAQPATNEGRGSIAVLLGTLLILVAPLLALHKLEPDVANVDAALVLHAADLTSQDWIPTLAPQPGFKPHFEQARADLQLGYQKAAGAPVGVYIAYYRHQDYASKLISSSNQLVPPDSPRWQQVEAGRAELSAAGQNSSWRSAEIRSTDLTQVGPARQLVAWQIYWVHGHWTRSDAMAKLYSAQSRLTGAGDDSAVLVLYAEAGDGGEALLRSFAQENFAHIDAWLSSVRDADGPAARRE